MSHDTLCQESYRVQRQQPRYSGSGTRQAYPLHSDVLADTKARSATTRMVEFVTVGWLSDGRADVITVSTASQTAPIAACIASTDVGQTSETQTRVKHLQPKQNARYRSP
jgi:hypothetical protein